MAVFYMTVRYKGRDGEPDLELEGNVNSSPNPAHGRSSVPVEWHKPDPVDSWERHRNDIIFWVFEEPETHHRITLDSWNIPDATTSLARNSEAAIGAKAVPFALSLAT